jgi:hypothetical protein
MQPEAYTTIPVISPPFTYSSSRISDFTLTALCYCTCSTACLPPHDSEPQNVIMGVQTTEWYYTICHLLLHRRHNEWYLLNTCSSDNFPPFQINIKLPQAPLLVPLRTITMLHYQNLSSIEI